MDQLAVEEEMGISGGFRFNGQPVPGSPFSCKVSPGNIQPRVPVSGSGIELASVSVPAEIQIEGVTGRRNKDGEDLATTVNFCRRSPSSHSNSAHRKNHPR